MKTCPDGWKKMKDICYFFNEDAGDQTFNDSKSFCEENGAKIMMPKKKFEYFQIMDLFPTEYVNTWYFNYFV